MEANKTSKGEPTTTAEITTTAETTEITSTEETTEITTATTTTPYTGPSIAMTPDNGRLGNQVCDLG